MVKINEKKVFFKRYRQYLCQNNTTHDTLKDQPVLRNFDR